LRAPDIEALIRELEKPSFAGQVETSSGIWRCTTGIVEKVCLGGDARISRKDAQALKEAVESASFGDSVETNAGTWTCSTGTAAGKACSFARRP
jgi:hypothetical protein